MYIKRKLPYWCVRIKTLYTSNMVGQWCQLPYHNHPKGCPKFNKGTKCPPKQKMVDKLFDLNRPLYFVHSEFNLSEHIDRMRRKHPSWSYHQCKCVLYWQSTSRNQLKERSNFFMIILDLSFS